MFTFRNIRAVPTNTKFHRNRIGFLSENVYQSVIETTNVLVPTIIFRVAKEKIFRGIRAIWSIGLNLQLESTLAIGPVEKWDEDIP